MAFEKSIAPNRFYDVTPYGLEAKFRAIIPETSWRTRNPVSSTLSRLRQFNADTTCSSRVRRVPGKKNALGSSPRAFVPIINLLVLHFAACAAGAAVVPRLRNTWIAPVRSANAVVPLDSYITITSGRWSSFTSATRMS